MRQLLGSLMATYTSRLSTKVQTLSAERSYLRMYIMEYAGRPECTHMRAGKFIHHFCRPMTRAPATELPFEAMLDTHLSIV
jgi:hypothetical protein